MLKIKDLFLIDDDIDDHEIFVSALKDADSSIVCHTAINGLEAFQKLLKGEVFPSVIFLDLNMPMMSGQDFLKQIKTHERLKSIPVIVFSTTSNKKIIEETKLLGAFKFFTKPNTFHELVDTLKALLLL